jgi:FtsP/CotA-like multicopper oxidase with cupredoxin domain
MSSFFCSRRQLLAGAATLTGLAAAPRFSRASAARPLAITTRQIEVDGRAATMFGIQQPDGSHGVTLAPGENFRVDLVNRCGEPAIIHWHGQTPPFLQDGVAGHGRSLIEPGGKAAYDFAPRPGTHWMHSHHGLQEQRLMAAPLIVHGADDLTADEQEVVVLLHDFTFRDPAEILAELTGGAAMMDHGAHGMDANMGAMDHAAMGHGSMDPGTMEHGTMAGMDLNDVAYDAYLANDRTLVDPQVIRTERRGRVRLRLINGATSTAFHIDLGRLAGAVIAVDGNAVAPVTGSRFPISMGQRLDIRVELPESGGAFPILAVREGDTAQTGIILATPDAAIGKIAVAAPQAAGPIGLDLERQCRAAAPLAVRAAAQLFEVALTGTMSPYVWSINDRVFGQHEPLQAKRGDRIELDLVNRTGMAHPMHLHGHHFQVTAIGDVAFAGAIRDTVLVPVGGRVRVAFDADNPGIWPLHCHNLLHMATGMMTEVVVA